MLVSLKTALKHTTVEIPYLFFCVTNEIIKILHNNLYLQKACRFNQTLEPDLDTPCDDEARGILFVSEISSKYYVINFCFCHIVTIFASCWSDEAGLRRRPLIFIPIIVLVLASLSGVLHSYVWKWDPIYAVVSEVLFESIGGGMNLLTYASQMYLWDICSAESRTMRLGILGTIKMISILIGKGGSGFLLRGCGFVFSYSVCCLFSTLSFVFALIFIRDTSVPVPVQKKSKIRQFFNLGMVLNSFRVVFKESLGKKRIVVLLLLITNVAAYFTTCGEFAVLYLYLRHRFQWDERKYSFFMLYKFTGSICGMLFGSLVLSKRLKIHDGLIGVFAGVWDLMAILGLLLAYQDWHIYIVPLLDIFHGTVLSVSTSFMSKYYESNEFGRLGAVYNVIGLITPFCYPMYNILFQKTMDTFPSMFCALSLVIDVGIVFLYGLSYYLSKKFEERKPTCKSEKS